MVTLRIIVHTPAEIPVMSNIVARKFDFDKRGDTYSIYVNTREEAEEAVREIKANKEYNLKSVEYYINE